MKHILQIEVEAPEYKGQGDFPPEVHASEKLNDWLRSALAMHFSLLAKHHTKPPSESGATFIAYQERVIKEIEAAILTVKAVK